MNDILREERPLEDAGLRIHGVDMPVAAAEIDAAMEDGRRRKKHVHRIGDVLICGRKAVKPLRFESSFSIRGKKPFHGSGVSGDGIECAVVAQVIDDSIENRG
jgi:hypothetical protein